MEDLDDFVSVKIIIIFMIWDGRRKEIREFVSVK